MTQHPDWPIQSYDLPCGMRLVALPQPNWLRTVVQLAIPFGACTTRLQHGNQTLELATGAAHLLEHCVMNSAQRRWQPHREAAGIPLQAQTGFYHTTYSFWTTESVLALLIPLIDAVSGLTEIDANDLAHEQRIVQREIAATMQTPQHLHRQSMLQALFQRHPVRFGILGEAAAVATMKAETILEAYHWLYRSSAMTLFIAGPINCDSIIDVLTQLPAQRQPAPLALTADEPREITTPKTTTIVPRAQSSLRLAFKEQDLLIPYQHREITSLLAMDLLNHALRRMGMRPSHSQDYAGHHDFGYSVMAWNTGNPDDTAAHVFTALERLKATPPTGAELTSAIQQRTLRVWQTMEQPEHASNWLRSLNFKGGSLSDYSEYLKNCPASTIYERLNTHFHSAACVTSILAPQS